METGLSEDKFWLLSPAPSEIFDYCRMSNELRNMAWGFDSGGVSADGKTTHANFSSVNSSGRGKDQLTVTASLEDGKWKLKHTVKLAGYPY